MSRSRLAGRDEGIRPPVDSVAQFPTKATHRQTRAHNAALVLRALYECGPVSRSEVARLTRLTRTTVGDVVSGLVAEGLARAIGRGPSTGGKQPILLELVDDARHVVGVDLGESMFRAGLVDLRGRVVQTKERAVGGVSGAEALDVVNELIDELVAGAKGSSLLGIGVGAPGIVDADTGTIRFAANLDWQDLPLGDLLRRRHGLPVEVVNDSRAAALAIQVFGSRRSSNLVAIKVGRGIGAGVVLRGELVHGDGFAAGEVGHVVVVDDGAQCRCGRHGCLETVASTQALLRNANDVARREPGSGLGRALGQRGELTFEDVAEAARAGDELARSMAADAGTYLGQAIAAVVGVLDIERIALHGPVTTLGEPWLRGVRDEVRRRLLPVLAGDVSIEVVDTYEDLVVRGASALILTAELGLVVA